MLSHYIASTAALSILQFVGNGQSLGDGAQGRDRTTDTAIFSRMLYQLSYLGLSGEAASPRL